MLHFAGTADQYELGDLGSKYGLIEGKGSFSIYYNETQASLFGPYSVLGRSVVIHKKVTVASLTHVLSVDEGTFR